VIRTDAVSGVTRVWARFKDYSPEASTAENSRFTVAGSARYDIWRVSLEAFAHHPVKGLGQDNFAREYLQSRQDPYETQRWTHSLWLRLLVHTGAVGFALFGAFLVLALAAAFRGWKAAEDGRRVVIGAALALPLVWLVHGTIDWLWEFPALSCPALAGLGLAVALSRTSPAPERTTPEVGVLPA
jgi:O-antigen ligase